VPTMARRRWRFRRGRAHQRILLDSANLGVQPKGTIVAAMAGGDGNGGPRPWFADSGELDGGAALSTGPGSISGSRRTRNTR
jgi:hypothetical protein